MNLPQRSWRNSRQEKLDSGTNAQHAMHDEKLPGDVGKAGWEIQSQSKVEQPVSNGSNTLEIVSNQPHHQTRQSYHPRSARLQRPHLRSIHPADRRQGQGVHDNQQIRKRDDRVRLVSRHLDQHVEIAVHAARDIFPS